MLPRCQFIFAEGQGCCHKAAQAHRRRHSSIPYRNRNSYHQEFSFLPSIMRLMLLFKRTEQTGRMAPLTLSIEVWAGSQPP